MQDVKVAVKTNDATTYVLTVTTAKDEFDTPNLRGNDAPVPSIDPVTRHWKIGEEDTGVVAEGKNGETYDDTDIQNALSALQGIIAGLNQSIANVQQAVPTKLSQLQNDDHAVKDADYVHTDNNYSDEEKTKVSESLRLKEYVDVESLEALPSAPYNLRFVYTSSTPQAINFADVDSVPEMQEFYLSILNSSGSDFDQPIPNGGRWLSDDPSVKLPNGKPTGVSLKKEFGVIVIRC